MFANKLLGLTYSRTSTLFFYSTRTKAVQQDPTKWRIEVALLIYRTPIIAPQMSEVEKQFDEMSELASHRSSLKCDFELQMKKDTELMEKRKKLEAEGKDLSALDEEILVASLQLKDDWLEKAEELIKTYNLNTRQAFDEEGPKSFRRKLDRKLALLVRQRFPDAPDATYVSPWILPRRVHSGDEETLRQTAEKLIMEVFPHFEQLPVGFQVLGNAPFSHYVQKYSTAMQKRLGYVGSVLFFYPVLLHQKTRGPPLSEVDMTSDSVNDYMWCTREEIEETLRKRQQGHRYLSAFNFAMIE